MSAEKERGAPTRDGARLQDNRDSTARRHTAQASDLEPGWSRAKAELAALRASGVRFRILANILMQPWRDEWSTDWFDSAALEVFLERERKAVRSAERSGSSKNQHSRRAALLEDEIERRRKKIRKRRNASIN